MFLDKIEITKNLNSFSLSRVGVIILNKLTMVSFLFLFVYKQTIQAGILVFLTLLFHFYDLKIITPDTFNQSLSKRFFRVDLKLPELKIIKFSFFACLNFLIYKILILCFIYFFNSKKIDGKLDDVVGILTQINKYTCIFWTMESYKTWDLLAQFFLVFILGVLTLMNKELKIQINNCSVAFYRPFFDKRTILLVSLILGIGITYREIFTERIRLIDFAETILRIFF